MLVQASDIERHKKKLHGFTLPAAGTQKRMSMWNVVVSLKKTKKRLHRIDIISDDAYCYPIIDDPCINKEMPKGKT
jgi:hypothetical protein